MTIVGATSRLQIVQGQTEMNKTVMTILST